MRNQSLIKSKADAKKKTDDDNYRYWKASVVYGKVVPTEPLTYSEARTWVAMENDLLCINHEAAFAIIKFYPSARWDRRHGLAVEGYLHHYHLSSAHKNHIWYLGE